jgi:hypothetical protein
MGGRLWPWTYEVAGKDGEPGEYATFAGSDLLFPIYVKGEQSAQDMDFQRGVCRDYFRLNY